MDNKFDIFLDAFFEKAMKTEDERYRNELSDNLVPLEKATINECVQFGKVFWKVIADENGKKLLLSRDCMNMDFDWKYGQEDLNNSTDNAEKTLGDICSTEPHIDYFKEFEAIRKYFREWFCDEYFSKEEFKKIIKHSTKIVEENNTSTYHAHVFLLSEAEVQKYIPAKEERVATMHVMFNDVARDWILRPESKTEFGLVVNTDGEIESVPDGCFCEWFRPAVWVDVSNNQMYD